MGFFPFVKRRVRLIAALIFAFLLTFVGGCQVHNDLAQMSSSIEPKQSIEEAFANQDFTQGLWISQNWWEMFQDQQLSELMEQMFENNPSLSEAVERVALAHKTASQQLSSILPSLDAQFTDFYAAFAWNDKKLSPQAAAISSEIVPKWINFLSTFLNFRWAIDIWGKNRYLYKAAQDQIKMQMAEAAQTKLMLSVQLCNSYFNLQQAMDQMQIQEEILSLMNQQLEITEKIYENELTDEIQLQELEKSILAYQNSILTTQENMDLSIHQIKALIGLAADNPAPLQKPLPNFGALFPFPENISIDFLLRRPDIVSKIWNIQSQAKKIKSAKVAFFPSVDLSSFLGFLTVSWRDLLKPRGWYSSLFPGAKLPLFEGLQLRSNLQYNVRQFNILVYDYNQAILTAVREIVDQITLFSITNQQLEKQYALLQKDRNLIELSSMRYEYGLNNYIDVLTRKINLLKDEIDFTNYNSLHLLAALNLIKSLGGGYQSPEAEEVAQENINL